MFFLIHLSSSPAQLIFICYFFPIDTFVNLLLDLKTLCEILWNSVFMSFKLVCSFPLNSVHGLLFRIRFLFKQFVKVNSFLSFIVLYTSVHNQDYGNLGF